MHSSKRLCSALLAALLASSGSYAITGKVTDQSGAAVANAMITYTDLSTRLTWTYSDNQGNFTLDSPEGTPVLGRAPSFAVDRMTPQVQGNRVYFTPAGKEATVSIVNLAGRQIASRTFKNLAAGRYSVCPFEAVAPQAGHTVYLVSITSGDQAASLRMVNLGSNRSGSSPRVSAADNAQTGLAKVATANQVRVGKTGYQPTLADFSGYTDNIGTVKITKVDIEAKVDSVINVILAHPKKKNILTGQSIMPPEGSMDAITTYNAAVMMYGANSMLDWNARREKSNQAEALAMANTADHLPIPLIIVGDIVHGYTCGPEGGVVLPHNIGLGCTFNPKIVEKTYRIAAMEARGAGFNFAFGPTTDVVRNDKHGRTYESFSEDPAHVAKMTKAAILGFQGTDMSHPWTIGSCAKHFAGAGGTENGLHMGYANTASDEVLRQIHLAPYTAALEVGVGAVMSAFNSWKDASGKQIPMHGNTELMQNTLKNKMGFDGFIFGDFEAHWYMESYYQTELASAAGTQKRVVLGSIAINAGLDVPLGGGVGSEWDWAPNASIAYDQGLLTDNRLVDMTKRILRVKFRMGLFDGDHYLFKSDLSDQIRSDKHKAVAREAVRKSLVCLKNQNSALPLKKTAKVHVVGTLADNMGCQSGGWTYGGPSTWQGDTKTDAPAGTSIKEAIEKVASRVTYSTTAAGIAGDADVVVVVTGETPYSESHGDHKRGIIWNQFTGVFNTIASSMILADMPEGDIINQVASATDKPVVAILISGRPMVLGTSLDNADAFVCAWLPGTEGDGVADVLFGDYDFTGKLSFSWPTKIEDEPLNTGSYGDTDTHATPAFSYGYGLNLAGQRLPEGWY
jgi:beta-glucosidase